MAQESERIFLRRKMPTYLFLAAITGLPGSLGACYMAAFKTHQIDVSLLIIALVFIPFASLYFLDRQYHVSWDDNHIYMKGWKCAQFKALSDAEIGMDMAGIRRIRGVFLDRQSLKKVFMPFEAVEITGRTRHEGKIILYPPSFYQRQVKQLMSYLYLKVPDSFSPEVLSLVEQ